MQLWLRGAKLRDSSMYEFTDLAMHLIFPCEDSGFDSNHLVCERFEKNTGMLKS
jgi:hypothetical protein